MPKRGYGKKKAASVDLARNALRMKYYGPEDHLHIQLCRYIASQYPGAVIHHSPNEGKRGYVEQMKLKDMRVLEGFVDLTIFYERHIFFLEVKAIYEKVSEKTGRITRTRAKISDAQKNFLAYLKGAGWPAGATWGFDEGVAWIDAHLEPLKKLNKWHS